MNVNFVGELKEAFQVLRLNGGKMADVAKKKEATVWGIAILAVPPVVNAILAALMFPSGFGSIFSKYVFWPVFIPAISYAITVFLMSLVAEKAFHGDKDHVGFFRIMAYASIILWLTVLPFLLAVLGVMADAYEVFRLIYLVAGAWMLYVSFYVLMVHNKLTKENAIFTVVIAIIMVVIVSSVLGKVLVGSVYSLY